MADQTKATVADTVEKIVATMIQKELIQKSRLMATTKDMSAMVGPGMDQLKIPRAGSFSPEAVVEGTDLTSQALTYATDNLDLDQHYAVLVRVTDKASLQSKIALISDIAKRQATALALNIDTAIKAEYLTSAGANLVSTALAGAAITRTNILEARKILNDKFAPEEDRFLLIGTEQEANMLDINDFIHADKYGTAESLMTGELGRIFGFRVIVTTLIGVDESIAAQREAVAFARQMDLRFEKDRNVPAQADEYAAAQLYGVQAQNPGNFAVKIGQ